MKKYRPAAPQERRRPRIVEAGASARATSASRDGPSSIERVSAFCAVDPGPRFGAVGILEPAVGIGHGHAVDGFDEIGSGAGATGYA